MDFENSFVTYVQLLDSYKELCEKHLVLCQKHDVACDENKRLQIQNNDLSTELEHLRQKQKDFDYFKKVTSIAREIWGRADVEN